MPISIPIFHPPRDACCLPAFETPARGKNAAIWRAAWTHSLCMLGAGLRTISARVVRHQVQPYAAYVASAVLLRESSNAVGIVDLDMPPSSSTPPRRGCNRGYGVNRDCLTMLTFASPGSTNSTVTQFITVPRSSEIVWPVTKTLSPESSQIAVPA